MIKTFITFLLAILSSGLAFAQEPPNYTVGIIQLHSETATPEQEETLHSLVQRAFRQNGLFTIIERESYDKIRRELEAQKGEQYIYSQIAEQGQALGVRYLALSTASEYERKSSLKKEGRQPVARQFTVKMALGLRIVDVQTGEVVHNEAIEGIAQDEYGLDLTEGSPRAPFFQKTEADALASVAFQLSDFLTEAFPPALYVVDILETRKESAIKVLVAGWGNLREGDALTAYKSWEKEDAGEMREVVQHLGKLKVSRVQYGEVLGECEVKEDGEVLLARFQAGDTIRCKVDISQSGNFLDRLQRSLLDFPAGN